ncbi:MAG: hypothetical protein P8I52_01635 [Flavobacteriales bacterium]|nr:hypothetical protein [Flavobacteriales bacterium]
MRNILFVFLLSIIMLSCSTKDSDNLIASVNEKVLLRSELLSEMPSQLEDSTYFVEKFINDWIRRQLLLSHAEINLSVDLDKYEKQVEDYRASLLIFAYQQELINQNLDSSISFSDINDYYDSYISEFDLSKNIFKGRFIIIDKLAPDINFVNSNYKSDNEVIIKELENYCLKYAKEYYIETDKWNYFTSINNKLPRLIDDEVTFLINTDGVFFEDANYRYYVYIDEYRVKGDTSPLALELDKIKDVLLNKKKVNYLKELEEDLYEIALSKKKINIY